MTQDNIGSKLEIFSNWKFMLLLDQNIFESGMAVLDNSESLLVLYRVGFPSFGIFVCLEDPSLNIFLLIFGKNYQKLSVCVSHPSFGAVQ